MTAAIHAEDLSYAYGDISVLKHLQIDVRQRDFFIIIGPNGSGKTTLLKLFAGILKTTRGRIDLFGEPIHRFSRRALARRMAFVPQTIPIDFPFTVAQVVLMGRAPHLGMLGLEQENDHQIARQAMAFTGIGHLADRRLFQLSGGERQRVFIARAICQETPMILLDEPTASLDLAHQTRVMDLMNRLKAEKEITIVMVSHDVNLAAMYGTHLLLLKSGGVVARGLPDEVLTYEALEQAYGCPLLVDESPLGRFPRVTPVPRRFLPQNKY